MSDSARKFGRRKTDGVIQDVPWRPSTRKPFERKDTAASERAAAESVDNSTAEPCSDEPQRETRRTDAMHLAVALTTGTSAKTLKELQEAMESYHTVQEPWRGRKGCVFAKKT